jgi:hypothetical protein
MKFYETHYEDYLQSLQHFNFHPELTHHFSKFPQQLSALSNLIFYGPPGVGKYTQLLNAIHRYSPSGLSYDKKICIQNEKYNYQYRISDIHYEVDMSLLGCNSKILWHEIIQQIVDIVAVKPEKFGIVVCKSFHWIHTELLEIFYSYIQEYNNRFSNIQLRFIIVSEHISFIPNNILSVCEIIEVKRPSKKMYLELLTSQRLQGVKVRKYTKHDEIDLTTETQFVNKVANFRQKWSADTDSLENATALLKDIEPSGILNLKEINNFGKIPSSNKMVSTDKIPSSNKMVSTDKIPSSNKMVSTDKIPSSNKMVSTTDNVINNMPKDIFNIVCDTIIEQMLQPKRLVHATFRDALYDILIYNLDAADCIWYIFSYMIENDHLKDSDISDVLVKMYSFLKYFNNNYRPIYHLESIVHYMIIKIFKYDELPEGV